MRSNKTPFHGWLVVDKPSGLSSNAVLTKIRHHFGRPKAGFAGTLDPFATGVLPIAFGEATKLMDYMVDTVKTYTFTVRWGTQTDTDDKDGVPIKTSDNRPTLDDIQSALAQFTGIIQQVPPQYSAVKVQGKRACDRVRQQEEVTLKARSVEVHDFKVLGHAGDTTDFQVTCGKGTYIRSLARDLAEFLGTCSHVDVLCRESVGIFSRERAANYNKLLEVKGQIALQEWVHPMAIVLDDIPALVIGEDAVKKIRHGQTISYCESLGILPDVNVSIGVLLKDFSQTLVAMSTLKEGVLHPNRVFIY